MVVAIFINSCAIAPSSNPPTTKRTLDRSKRMILDDRIRDDPGKLSSLAGSIMYRVKGSQMRYFDEASPRNSVDTAPLDHSVFNYSLQKRGYSSTALEWISWLSIDVGKQSEDKVELVIKQV